MSLSFGVHLGESSACLALSRDGRVDVVANDAGDRCTPGIVAWNSDEVLVGLSAAQYGARNPHHAVKHNQKLLAFATDVDTFKKEIEIAIEKSGVPNGPRIVLSGGRLLYHIDGGNGEATKKIPPTSVQTHIYKYMHDIAAAHATDEVDAKNTVLTVPYHFSLAQRQVVAKCAENAGFHVVQVISQPAAACLAYSLGQLDNTECLKCLVYRCGGNSLTVSAVEINGGIISVLKCLTFGVGGDEITQVLADFLALEFQRKHRMDPRESKRSKLKLKIHAGTVKHILSTLDTSNCYIESLHEGIDFSVNVTRARFENELGKVLPSFVDPITTVLAEAGIKATDIDKVILCGGTTKIPKIKASIASLFPKSEVLSSLSPDEVLALGAATQSSLMNEPWKDNVDTICPTIQATSHSIVFMTSLLDEGMKPVVLIPERCSVPTRRSHHMTLSEEVAKLSIKLFLKSTSSMHELGELTLSDLSKESKLSISAHIHRDGGVHFGLTDKVSGNSDQLTLQAPQA